MATETSTNIYQILADNLYTAYRNQGRHTYLFERVKSLFYGKIVRDHIPVFLKLHDYLVANGHTKDNPLWQGDDDNAVWYEKTKDDFIKVLVDSRVVSCADDYTHIFVFEDYGVEIEGPEDSSFNLSNRWVKLRCFTAWPRQIPARQGGHKWGDHRDIKYPSVSTHRKANWKFGYQDGRDDFYCFAYDSFLGDVKDAHWKESKMVNALDTLTYDWGDIERNNPPF